MDLFLVDAQHTIPVVLEEFDHGHPAEGIVPVLGLTGALGRDAHVLLLDLARSGEVEAGRQIVEIVPVQSEDVARRPMESDIPEIDGLIVHVAPEEKAHVVGGNDIFYAPVAFDGLTLLWGVVSYSLVIYFDFSGYSDMAIGVSKMFGFDFPDNFNFPYLAQNITEFWKRWHISLSSWLKEYVYFPLGGNREGRLRAFVNLFLTMLLGGLWHGAAWTFVVWGAFHGLALIIHKIFVQWKEAKFENKKAYSSVWNIISVVITFSFVTFCWIFFKATSFKNAAEIIKGIFTMQVGISQPYTWSIFSLVLLVIASFLNIKISQNANNYSGVPIQDLSTIKGQTIFFILCGLTIILAHVGNTSFIYNFF